MQREDKDLAVLKPEITNLNINDLNVQELERRLELAATGLNNLFADSWLCVVDCPNLSSICGTDLTAPADGGTI